VPQNRKYNQFWYDALVLI